MAFIRAAKAYTYFKSNFSLKKTSQNWHAFCCPFCNETTDRKKMAVHFTYKKVKCWVCGYNEFISQFVSDIEGVDYKEARDLVNSCKPTTLDMEAIEGIKSNRLVSGDIKIPHGYQGILDGKGVLADRARKYLKSRGFNLKRMSSMGFGYCNETGKTAEENYFGYIIVPFKSKGKLVYYIGRDFIGNFLRYKNPDVSDTGIGKSELFFNEDALDLYEEIFVLEGWADAYTIGGNAVASLGWKLSDTQKSKIIKSDVDIVTLVPDSGKDGQGISFYYRSLELALELSKYKKVKVVDSRDFKGGKDVNEIGREAFMEYYNQCSILDETDITCLMLGL